MHFFPQFLLAGVTYFLFHFFSHPNLVKYKDVWKTENKYTETNKIKANFKKVKKEVEMNQNGVEEFLQEAIRMRQFDHSNVLSIIGVSVLDDKPGVVLPLMSNGDLKNYLMKNSLVSINWYLR